MKNVVWALALGMFVFGCKGADDAKTDAPAGDKTGGANEAAAGGYAGVQALLTARCMPCHGENGKEGIDLRSYESVMKGGEHGAIVKADDPSSSQIVHALKGENGAKKMPMNQPSLSAEDIKKVEDWIAAGAKAG